MNICEYLICVVVLFLEVEVIVCGDVWMSYGYLERFF